MPIRERYYTPQEANACLPFVHQQVAALQALAAELRSLKQVVEAAAGPAGVADEMARAAERMQELERGARVLLHSLEEREIELKDLDAGLLDFPALLNGRQVLLCYRCDEPSVAHYHGLQDGFSGRRPLGSTPASAWEWCN